MKYLRRFQTNVDYQAFKDGDDWVIPNVSTIEEDNKCVYNSFIRQEYSFSVENPSITCYIYPGYEDMTWKEWVDEGLYNIEPPHNDYDDDPGHVYIFTYDDNFVYSDGRLVCFSYDDRTPINRNDVIIPDHQYCLED